MIFFLDIAMKYDICHDSKGCVFQSSFFFKPNDALDFLLISFVLLNPIYMIVGKTV